MKIKDNKCKCGHDDFFFADKGNQTGIYCSYCGKWFKWADKDEQNLRMRQKSVLGKVRAEIEKQEKWLMDAGYTAYNVDIAFSSIKSVLEQKGARKNEQIQRAK